MYSLLNKVPSTNKMIDTTKIIVGMLFLAMAGLLGWYGRASKTGGVTPGPMFNYPPESPAPMLPTPVPPTPLPSPPSVSPTPPSVSPSPPSGSPTPPSVTPSPPSGSPTPPSVTPSPAPKPAPGEVAAA